MPGAGGSWNARFSISKSGQYQVNGDELVTLGESALAVQRGERWWQVREGPS